MPWTAARPGDVTLGIVWDGIVGADVLHGTDAEVRHELADAAKRYDWTRAMAILREHPTLVNTSRPGGGSRFAPLHQAAHGGAPLEVAEELILLGAWRTLRNALGQRPIDVADRRGHKHLLGVMEPRLKRHVPIGVLLGIQSHFHDVILSRAAAHVRDAAACGCPNWSPYWSTSGQASGSPFPACTVASPTNSARTK